MLKHAMANAMLPLVTLAGLDLAGLLSGVVLTETVFNWPGIGRLAFEAIFNLDIPLIMGTVLFSAFLIVVANLLVDLLYAWLDPRISARGDAHEVEKRSSRWRSSAPLMVAVLVIVAVFAPWLAPHDPTRAVAPTFGDPGAPSLAFPLGTDQLGRDVLSRIIYGARISLTVGVAAMAVTMTIGVAIGLCAGFLRRRGRFRADALHRRDADAARAAARDGVRGGAAPEPAHASCSSSGWSRGPRSRAWCGPRRCRCRQRDFVVAARALGAPSAPADRAPSVAQRAADNRRDGGARHLRHAAARRGPELPRPRRAAADAELGPDDRRGDDLLSHRAVARDFPRPRDLLRGAWASTCSATDSCAGATQ